MRAMALWAVLCSSVAASQPNILVINVDDWGVDRFPYMTPGASSTTPNLDFIAQNSLLFEQFYTDPVCSPSRVAAMTGKLGVRTGITTGVKFYDETDPFTFDISAVNPLAQELRQAGYRCGAFGKWHLTPNEGSPYTHPMDMGFHRFRGLIANLDEVAGEVYDSYQYVSSTAQSVCFSHESDYATTTQVNDTLNWVAAQGDDPWFAWQSFTASHEPWSLPPQHLVSVDLSTVFTTEQAYNATLEAMDTEIGRLINTLPGLEDTIVFIFGDNGTPKIAFDANVSGKKGTVKQGGIHTPLMVWRYGVTPGVVTDLVHVVDIYDTVLELASVAPQEDDSRSFAPALSGHTWEPRTWIYSARRRPNGFSFYDLDQSAVLRNDQYKLIRKDSGYTLYMVGTDDSEVVTFNPPVLMELMEIMEEVEG